MRSFCHAEITAVTIRGWIDGGTFGDPFDWVCRLDGSGDHCTVSALLVRDDKKFTRKIYEQIDDAARSLGFKRRTFARYKNGKRIEHTRDL